MEMGLSLPREKFYVMPSTSGSRDRQQREAVRRHVTHTNDMDLE